MDAVSDRLGRFFGKGGGAVVEANLAVIGAAYDGLIDVSAALDLPSGEAPQAVATRLEPEGVAR